MKEYNTLRSDGWEENEWKEKENEMQNVKLTKLFSFAKVSTSL